MKNTLALVALIALMCTPIFAQEAGPEAVQEAGAAVVKPEKAEAQVELTIIEITNTKYEESKLTGDYRAVANEIADQIDKVTFEQDGKYLRVGINAPEGVADGAVIARIEFRSDCPNNSQYFVEETPAVLAGITRKQLQAIVATWTRYRHDSPKAGLRVVNVTQRGRQFNYDVQLDLKKVAVLEKVPKLASRR